MSPLGKNLLTWCDVKDHALILDCNLTTEELDYALVLGIWCFYC